MSDLIKKLGELHDAREVAGVLGITEGTLANWRCRRTGPAYVYIGGRVRYRARDLERWMAERSVETE